jgi:predicted DNA-binding transcriptional regulator AlpA
MRGPVTSSAPTERSHPSLPERLWTHQETAEFLGIPPKTLHQMNYKRTGPRSYKIGKHRRYNPADVGAWLDDHVSDAR